MIYLLLCLFLWGDGHRKGRDCQSITGNKKNKNCWGILRACPEIHSLVNERHRPYLRYRFTRMYRCGETGERNLADLIICFTRAEPGNLKPTVLDLLQAWFANAWHKWASVEKHCVCLGKLWDTSFLNPIFMVLIRFHVWIYTQGFMSTWPLNKSYRYNYGSMNCGCYKDSKTCLQGLWRDISILQSLRAAKT